MKYTLAELGAICGGEVVGNPDRCIRGALDFDSATSADITFAANPKFLKRIDETAAGALILPRAFTAVGRDAILVDYPQAAFAKVLALFFPPEQCPMGISDFSRLGEGVSCGDGISISHFVSIGDNTTIGDRTIIYPGVVIGREVHVGEDVRIYPNVTIMSGCKIGNRVIIHAGTVIGSDGFGFAPEGEIYRKIPHTGIVEIGDDVEIGALNAIDRATFGSTSIKQGVKTDNLVHVGHNVTVGENSILVAHVGISGSTALGKHVVMAGQSATAGHITIGDNVIVGGQSGVTKSLEANQIVSGTPAMQHRLWLKVSRVLPRLPDLIKKVVNLEKRLSLLEKQRSEGPYADKKGV